MIARATGWPILMRDALAAEYLDVSPSTLSRLKAESKITPRMIRGSVRYHRADLDAYADSLPDAEMPVAS